MALEELRAVRNKTHPREVCDFEPRVRLDDLEDPLRAERTEDVVDVAADERVVHDGFTIVCTRHGVNQNCWSPIGLRRPRVREREEGGAHS